MSNQKGNIIFIILGIIAAAIIAGGAGYFVAKKQAQKEESKEQARTYQQQQIQQQEQKSISEITEQKIQQSEVKDETADWKIYRNEKYGFNVKYPSNWSYQENTIARFGARYKYQALFQNKFDDPLFKGFAVKVYDNIAINFTDELSADKPIVESCMPNLVNAIIGANNYSAIEIYFNDNPCYKETYFYSIQKENYRYNIIPLPERGIEYLSYDGKKEVQNSLPEFDKILSTFKFTK